MVVCAKRKIICGCVVTKNFESYWFHNQWTKD